MNTDCYVVESETVFVLADVDPAYHQAVRDLGYHAVDGAFRRTLPTDLPNIDGVCANFARYAETMVLQAARVQPVPWEHALHAFLHLVEPHAINWWLAGSAALAVRGLDVQPRDFDVVVDEAGAHTLGDVLHEYLVEPVSSVGWFCTRWGRAFLHARIEWVGGVDERADTPVIGDFGPAAARRLERVRWHGWDVDVPPLDLQLAVSKRRGLAVRVAQIERLMNRTP